MPFCWTWVGKFRNQTPKATEHKMQSQSLRIYAEKWVGYQLETSIIYFTKIRNKHRYWNHYTSWRFFVILARLTLHHTPDTFNSFNFSDIIFWSKRLWCMSEISWNANSKRVSIFYLAIVHEIKHLEKLIRQMLCFRIYIGERTKISSAHTFIIMKHKC